MKRIMGANGKQKEKKLLEQMEKVCIKKKLLGDPLMVTKGKDVNKKSNSQFHFLINIVSTK